MYRNINTEIMFKYFKHMLRQIVLNVKIQIDFSQFILLDFVFVRYLILVFSNSQLRSCYSIAKIINHD